MPIRRSRDGPLLLIDCRFEYLRLDPPLQHIIGADPPSWPRIRGVLSDQALEQRLQWLRDNRSQLAAQELLPTVPADGPATSEDVVADLSWYYWVPKDAPFTIREQNSTLLEWQMSPRRARSSRTTVPSPAQTSTGGRHNSDSRSNYNRASGSSRIEVPLRFLQPVEEQSAEASAHPSGLPHKDFRYHTNNAAIASNMSTYRTFVTPSQRCLQAVWVPSWDVIREAYNLSPKPSQGVVALQGDAAVAADHVARFQAAYFGGPLYVATKSGHDDKQTLDLIQAEYNVLVSTLIDPFYVSNGRDSVSVSRYATFFQIRLATQDGRTPRIHRNCQDENHATACAMVLARMFNDPDWQQRPRELIWAIWKELVFRRDLGEQWLADSINEDYMYPVMRRRIDKKQCRAPGLEEDCYRASLGQICKCGTGKYILDWLSAQPGIDIAHFSLMPLHKRPARKSCSEMTSGVQCVDHRIGIAGHSACKVRPELYSPDEQDKRFVQPGKLSAVDVPQVDVTFSGKGSIEIGATVMIFASTESPQVASSCAVALGVIPEWATLAALPTGAGLLAPRVEQILDRTDIVATARPCLDRLWAYCFLDDGKIAAHHASNLRIVDTARNIARGQRHSTQQADLLEAAVVFNNTVRLVLGDPVAERGLNEVLAAVTGTVSDPAWKSRLQYISAYDAAKPLRAEMATAKLRDNYSLEGYPMESLNGLNSSTKRSCKALLASLAGSVEALSQEPSLEGETVPDDSLDDAADEGADEAPNQEDLTDQEENIRDGTVRTFRRLEFSAAQVSGIAAVASEIEATFGRGLPRQGSNCLPRLSFLPAAWSDDDYLSYAADADTLADDCDDKGQCPVPPRKTPTEQGHPPEATINAIIKTARSPGTLFLAWLRLDLQGKLDECRITGLPLTWPKIGPWHSPLRASRAAHLVHRFPLSYGFTVPWPTSLRQFKAELFNVSVESWFGNKWLRTHRVPALGALLLRRTDWFLRHADKLGLTPLTQEQARRVREHCCEEVRFRHQESLNHNTLSEGEQVVWARRAGFDGSLTMPGAGTAAVAIAGAVEAIAGAVGDAMGEGAP